MTLSKLQEILEDRGVWRVIVCGVAKSRARLSDRTTTKWELHCLDFPGGSVAKNLPANAGDTRDASSIP